jgi:hypothetical protein
MRSALLTINSREKDFCSEVGATLSGVFERAEVGLQRMPMEFCAGLPD